MTPAQSPLRCLSSKLCPWLEPALQQIETAWTGGRLGHGLLLAGPRGIGKINLALTIADRLLTGRAGTALPPPLGPEEAAAAMAARHAPVDHHPDLYWLYPAEDKRTISVDQVRSVSDALALKGYQGATKVVVVEPADYLTTAAANALLKTLEEPTDDTYLLLLSHQPQRVPATVRSRCQALKLPCPPLQQVREWLSVEDVGVLSALWLATDGAPLRISALVSANLQLINMNLEDKILLISNDKIDPQTVADQWLELDLDLVLTWLIRRIQLAIRARVVPGASTRVTDLDVESLHNAWADLTLRTLFGRLGAAEKLLNQLGTGVNVDLALRVLLLGFQTNRGQS